MNDIALIIVTAFVNILITGIVSNLIFYRYQKRIDLSIDEKLEKFRSDLQYSIFEKQTKFSRIFEKRAETFENLFKMFADLTHDFEAILNEIVLAYPSRTEEEYKKWITDLANLKKKLEDFFICYRDSMMFFPDDITSEIMDSYFKVNGLHYLMTSIFETMCMNPVPKESIQNANKLIKKLELEVTKINIKKPSFQLLLNEIAIGLVHESYQMQDIYQKLIGAEETS